MCQPAENLCDSEGNRTEIDDVSTDHDYWGWNGAGLLRFVSKCGNHTRLQAVAVCNQNVPLRNDSLFRSQRNASLSAARLIKYLQFAYLSKSPLEKTIFRTIRSISAGHIVEIGVGRGELAHRMIEQAICYTNRPRVTYTGIDLFELRADGSEALELRAAYQMLSPLDARVRLIPGEPDTALARRANTLLDTDLLVVHAGLDAERMRRAWYYVPRMLQPHSRVIVESAAADQRPQVLDLAAVHELAQAARSQRRAA